MVLIGDAEPGALSQPVGFGGALGPLESQSDVGAGGEEILVIRHGSWNELFPVQHHAFGLGVVLEGFPSLFAAPVFLQVKNGDEGNERRQYNQGAPLHLPAEQPVEKSRCERRRLRMILWRFLHLKFTESIRACVRCGAWAKRISAGRRRAVRNGPPATRRECFAGL